MQKLTTRDLIENQNGYKFNFELTKDSKDKNVYELELIAVYRKNN